MEHRGRTAFRHAIRRSRHSFDPIEAALAVAQEDLDLPEVDSARDLLDSLADRTLARLGPAEASLDYAQQMVQYLHKIEGFTGNTTAYDDPANSYLPLVCEYRSGLPITLTLVLLYVGRAIGAPLEPAGLPLHFMARWPLDDGNLFLDLFFGQVLDARGCRIFLQAQSGTTLPDPDLFPPTPANDVVARLLRNLKHGYLRRGRLALALAAVERILLVSPDSVEDVRDRGLLRIRLGDLHRGLHDLERYASEEPLAPDQAQLRQQAQHVAEQLYGLN